MRVVFLLLLTAWMVNGQSEPLRPVAFHELASITGLPWPGSHITAVHSSRKQFSLLVSTDRRDTYLIRFSPAGQLLSKRQLSMFVPARWIDIDSEGILFAPKVEREGAELKPVILAFDLSGAVVSKTPVADVPASGFLSNGTVVGVGWDNRLIGGPNGGAAFFPDAHLPLIHASRLDTNDVVLVDAVSGKGVWLAASSLARKSEWPLVAEAFQRAEANVGLKHRHQTIMIGSAAPGPDDTVLLSLGSAFRLSEGVAIFAVDQSGTVRRTIRCALPTRPEFHDPEYHMMPSLLATAGRSIAIIDRTGWMALYTLPE